MPKRRRWGRIRKLPSGRYQARYPGPDGQTHPAPHTFPTKTDADVWLNDKEAEIRRNGWQDPNAGRDLLNDYAERWMTERVGLGARTREKYERLLRLHIRPQLGMMSLEDITTASVRTWRAERLAALAPKGGPTVAGSYRLLRAVLNTAVEDGKVSQNPCRVKGADKDNSPERPTITVTEVYAIADAIKPWWRCLVLMGAFTSLRWGELVALRRRHLDLVNGIVEVKVRLAEVGGEFQVGQPKGSTLRRSGVATRVVAIPSVIIPELRAHLASEWIKSGRNGRVFIGPKGATPKRSNFNRYWKAAVKKAGVEVDPELGLHFHDLRHVGNDLRAPGASLRDLMDHMGHSTQAAALIYQHGSMERQQVMAELVSAAIEEVRGHVGGTPNKEKAVEDDSGESSSAV